MAVSPSIDTVHRSESLMEAAMAPQPWMTWSSESARTRSPRRTSAPESSASRLVDPLAVLLRPIAALDPFPARQKLPGQAGAFERGGIEQIEAAIVAQCGFAPLAVGDQHIAREIGRVRAGREQDRLARVVGAAGEAMGKEAGR